MRKGLTIVLLILASCTSSTNLAPQAIPLISPSPIISPAPTPSPKNHVGAFGAQTMIYSAMAPQDSQALITQASLLRVTWIRVNFQLWVIFPSSGQQDWSGTDAIVAAATSHKLNILAEVDSMPAWAASCPSESTEAYRCPPSNYGLWSGWWNALATRYKGRVQAWEVWDRPNIGGCTSTCQGYFYGTTADYAHMFDSAQTAVKAVDPTAQMALGSVELDSGRVLNWLNQALQDPLYPIAGKVDIATFHLEDPIDALTSDLGSLERAYQQAGFSKNNFWVTEHGYPSDPAWQKDPHYKSGEASQAAYLGQSIPLIMQSNVTKLFVDLRDGTRAEFYDSPQLSIGLVTWKPGATPTPKSSFTTVLTLFSS